MGEVLRRRHHAHRQLGANHKAVVALFALFAAEFARVAVVLLVHAREFKQLIGRFVYVAAFIYKLLQNIAAQILAGKLDVFDGLLWFSCLFAAHH